MLEVTCGGASIEGVKLRVPAGRFPVVIARLKSLDLKDKADFAVLLSFLRNRCGKQFLADFLSAVPSFLRRLEYGAWMIYNNEIRLAAKLHKYALLPEKERRRLVDSIKYFTLRFGDAGCYREPEIRAVLNDSEHHDLRFKIQARLFGALRADITETKQRCIREKLDAWSEFVEVSANLASFEQEFSGRVFQERLLKVKNRVRHIKWDLHTKRHRQKGALASDTVEAEESARSIFDDVDQ